MSESGGMRLLLVEDEQDLLLSIADFLSRKGHVVDTAEDGRVGLNLALAGTYDAMVLDLGLPKLDGVEVCRRLRASDRAGTAILMLTARDRLEDKLAGFDSGTDDYLVKPFALPELERRLHALVRRARLNRGQVLEVADLRYAISEDRVTRAGRELSLTPAARKLLKALMQQSPQVVSRETLEYALWGDSPGSGEALKAHIHLLRLAVDGPFDKALIQTARTRGYRIAN